MSASALLLAIVLARPLSLAPTQESGRAPELVIVDASGDASGETTPEPGWRFEFAPARVLYPDYVADPRRPTFSLMFVDARESDIDEATDRRYGLRMGTRFGILELAPGDGQSGALQLAGEVGFLAQFDRDNRSDNLGWDGLYGFHLAWQARRDLVLRVGMAHDSSHLGDELIEDTNRQRIEYTREEVLAGLHYAPLEIARGYVEYGKAYDMRNEDLMEEGRVQLGLVLESESLREQRRVAPFAALDMSAYEEDDWEENLTVQVGVVRFGAGRGGPWRLGVEYYDGRSVMGEFFEDRERHFAWGLWLDL